MLSNMFQEDNTGIDRVILMAHSLIEEAIKLGLSPIKPITLEVLGNMRPEGIEVGLRTAIVAYTAPVCSVNDTQLWVNASTNRILKSLPTDRVWRACSTRSELFAK